jgi:uncharacterized membrane protein YdjX (TVP38/TMEM64 family)
MKNTVLKLVFAIIWIFMFYQFFFNSDIRVSLLFFIEKYHLMAPFLLVLLQVILASFALPCSPLSVLTGALWGWQWGIFYSTIATLASSLWTFFLGRSILKSWFDKKKSSSWWSQISGLILKYGWWSSMIAHANPVLPGSSLGYMFGASAISIESFAFGVVIGTLPLQLIMVAIGHYAESIAINLKFTSLYILVGLTVAFILYKTIIPKVVMYLNDGAK